MPLCSTLAIARSLTSSSLISLAASSSRSSFIASRIRTLRVRRRPPMPWNRPCSCCVSSSMPAAPPTIGRSGIGIATSSSISLSSSSPSRSFLRNFCRVAESAEAGSAPEPKPSPRAGGSSTSSTRSSAASIARDSTFLISASRACLTPISARSRTIESTSLPT